MKRFWILITSIMVLGGCTDYRAGYLEAVRTLSDTACAGRSLWQDGDMKAAQWLIGQLDAIDDIVPCPAAGPEDRTVTPEFKSAVMPADAGRWAAAEGREACLPYLQHFQFPMNVMRGEMSLAVDGVSYAPTFDFTVKEFSPTCHGFFKVAYLDEEAYDPAHFVETLQSGMYHDQFVVVDWERYLETMQPEPLEKYKDYLVPLTDPAGIILRQQDQFPYFKARSWYQSPRPILFVNGSFPDDAREIELHVDSEMIPMRDAHNIVAWLPGSDPKCDTYYTFIAHYDHLGCMGRDFVFPGANDNASGSAMLLTLARYFSKHRPKHGIQFIWFDAEEENLLGSFFYCGNPRMPLDKIEYLIDLDMVADDGDHLDTEISETGAEGLQKFMSINSDGKFAPFDIDLKPLSDNSDHYGFAMLGVPCIYFMTEGSMYEHYHTPRDSFEHAADANFDRLMHLVTEFVE